MNNGEIIERLKFVDSFISLILGFFLMYLCLTQEINVWARVCLVIAIILLYLLQHYFSDWRKNLTGDDLLGISKDDKQLMKIVGISEKSLIILAVAINVILIAGLVFIYLLFKVNFLLLGGAAVTLINLFTIGIDIFTKLLSR